MKKLCCALLALVLMLSLAACGKKNDIPVSALNRTQFMEKVEQSQYALTLTINPCVKLFFKTPNELLAVQCVNEDARGLFDGVELFTPHQSYEAFLIALLDKAMEEGYLKNNCRLRSEFFAVSDQDGMDNLSMHTSDVLGRYLQDKKLTVERSTSALVLSDAIHPENPERFEVQSSTTPDLPSPSPSVPPTKTPSNVVLGENETVLEVDEQGKVRKTEQRDSDGSVTHRVYGADGKLIRSHFSRLDGFWSETSYSDGLAILIVDHEGNRTTRTYHADRSLAGEITRSHDGSYHETTYDLKGNTTYSLSQFFDGSWEEVRYLSGGKPTKRTFVDAGGNEIIETYHFNGYVASQVIQGTNGYYSEKNYNESGQPTSQKETDTSGSTVEISYYANGNRRTQVTTHSDGTTEIWRYTEDGTSGTMTNMLGTYTETYHPNGKVATWSHMVAPDAKLDYTSESNTYSATGNLQTHTKTFSDGTKVVSTHHSSTAYTTVFTTPTGGSYTEYWVSNVKIGGIDLNGNPYGTTHKEYSAGKS